MTPLEVEAQDIYQGWRMVLIILSITAFVGMIVKMRLTWRERVVARRLADLAMLTTAFTASATYTYRFFMNTPGDFGVYLATFPMLFICLHVALTFREVEKKSG